MEHLTLESCHIKKVGSGLNDKRKHLQKLLTMVGNHEVRNVYITYKDRLTRFGFKLLRRLLNELV